MHKKRFRAIAVAGILGLLVLAPISDVLAAGWTKSGDSWVYYDNNGSLYKGWIRTTDGYYYLDLTTGKMTLGWKQINNKWYYFKSNGLMVSNTWITVDGKFYYLLDDGTMGLLCHRQRSPQNH